MEKGKGEAGALTMERRLIYNFLSLLLLPGDIDAALSCHRGKAEENEKRDKDTKRMTSRQNNLSTIKHKARQSFH